MSADKKPGFWGRLLGLDKPAAPDDTQQALERATAERQGEQEALAALKVRREAAAGPADEERTSEPTGQEERDGRDAAPPEMQAEWIRAGHPNPPEPEPDVPEDVWNPLDRPSAIRDKLAERPPEPPEAAAAPPDAAPPDTLPRVAAPAEPQGWFQRLRTGLRRSSDQLSSSIGAIFTKRRLDDATLDDLEDILIQADLGVETAVAITERLRADKFDKDIAPDEVRAVLAAEVEQVLAPVAAPLAIDATRRPFVVLMVGVNGSGKTTTIGKLAAKLKAQGKSVLLAAGDTFRAAAVEQLQVWGQRTQTRVVTRPTGADAAGLAYDALAEAKAEGTDVLIVDTAGRLQNRTELMDELAKVVRVIKKLDPSAPHAVLLTLDATTGQNALNQVEIFGQKAGVTGLVMTKLDGTARGGILVAIARKYRLPVHFLGVGEGIDDLEPFKADEFARAIAGRE